MTQKETKGGRNITLPALLGKSSCPISIVCKKECGQEFTEKRIPMVGFKGHSGPALFYPHWPNGGDDAC